MKDFLRFLEPVFKTKFVYLRGFFIIFFQWLNLVAHIFFIQHLTSALEKTDKILFEKIIYFYIAYIIIYEIFYNFSIKYTWPLFYNQTIRNVQENYIQDFIKLDNNKTESIWTWKLIAIMKWWIEMWWNLMDMIFHRIPNILITVVFTLFMLFSVKSIYVLIFFILYIFFFIIASFFNKKVRNLRKERSQNKIIYTKNFVKVLMSKYEILQTNKIENELKNLNYYQKNAQEINQKMSFDMSMIYRIPQFWMDLLLLAIFIFFWKEVFDGNMTIATFVWITAMFVLMKRAINESMDLYKNFTKDFIEVKNLWDLFDNTEKINLNEDKKDFKYKNGNIEIKNLDFAYENSNKKIFENFSLEIKWWKTTAFVWESGSGKTTLVKLIASYISSKNGKIIIDWQDLSEVSLKSYYKNIWYLTQEPSIFDGTIYENLTYAVNYEVSEKEIENAINMAKCEFIYDFEEWIQTQIWEKWIKLSGWQRQRLAIAKILLKNPKIILLDEPTSALDSFSEEQITKAMENLFIWRTVIIIAHRLQTVKNADEIIVFEKWKILERWNHKELEEKNWVYKKLLELQSGF